MLLTILFWIAVAVDVAACGLFFVLALAAAGPSHTNPFALLPFALVTGLALLGSIVLFVRSSSPVWRISALLAVASPVLWLVISGQIAAAKFRTYQQAGGAVSQFRDGPLRRIEAALSRNDVAAVTAAAPAAQLNEPGLSGATILLLAIRQLEKTPDQLDVLRALLRAGTDPNQSSDGILPLAAAVAMSRNAGPEPVRLLLSAGAKPNGRDGSGSPAYFAAAYGGVDAEIMKLLLEHKADLQATNKAGHGPLFEAGLTENWKVALLLLELGADSKVGRTPSGKDFGDMVESAGNYSGGKPDYVAVRRFLEARGRAFHQ